MMKRIVVTSFLFLIIFTVSAQEYNTRFLVKSTIGYTRGLNSMYKDYLTDGLISYSDESFQVNVVSNSLFFGKKRKWGVELSLLSNYSSRPDIKQFKQLIENSYNDYDIESRINYTETNLGQVFSGVGGIVYRFEKKQIVLISRCLFGVSEFKTDSRTANLKRKNTNLYYQLGYYSNSESHSYFTLDPALTLGYRLNRFLMLSVDLMYTNYKVDFSYRESLTNLYTSEVSEKAYGYNHPVSNISIGIGVNMFVW